MCTPQAADYEAVAYTNNAFPASHPSSLAMVAELHGLDVPTIDRCRVLEVGSGRGGNLLPMAEGMPASEFVGIDLSPRQIAEANSAKAQLGLENVAFHTMDLMDFGVRFGKFDFILAHGVYSWVPRSVQEGLLDLCRNNLSNNGVAYISYNTLPGWRYRGVVRDLLRQQIDRRASPNGQIRQARSLLDFVVGALPDREGIRTKLVIDECSALQSQADGYIYHDHLEPENHPCYFQEFVTHAGEHDLAFVAEAQPNPLTEALDAETLESVRDRTRGDAIRSEQLIDFLTHRTFRRSVVCHSERHRHASACPDRIRRFFVTSLCHPTGEYASDETAPVTFHTTGGDAVTTNHPLVRTTLLALYELGPVAQSFGVVAAEVAGRLGRGNDSSLASELEHVLLATYRRGAVQLSISPSSFCPRVTDRPLAGGVARLQAAGDSRVTNRQHRSIELNPVDRFLLTVMDGQQGHDELATLLRNEVRRGNLGVRGLDGISHGEELAFFQRLFAARASYLASSAYLVG